MNFVSPTLPAFLAKLEQLNNSSEALWGSMSVQRMVEHLSDSVILSIENKTFKLSIPEDKIERAQQFLLSEHPLPKNFTVEFATPDIPERNQNLNEAIEEFKKAWQTFELHYQQNPEAKSLHPSFGYLEYDQWLRMHAKHVTHHLAQFGI